MNALEALALGVVGLVLLFGLAHAWHASNKARSLDADLPSALFSMASYDAHVPLESVLSGVASASPDPLRTALSDCVVQVRSGVPLSTALKRLSRRHGSPLMDRVVVLLQAAHQSGADFSDAIRRVAQDAFEFQRLQTLRRESFAVQKYTLYAGAILVPALLGLLYSWMQAESSPYGASVFWGLQVYLTAFGFLTATFVSAVTSEFRSLPVRGAFLSVFVLWVFHAVRLSAGA